MKGRASFVLSLLLAGTAAAQTRVALPVDAPAVAPSGAVGSISVAPSSLIAVSLAPSAFSAGPSAFAAPAAAAPAFRAAPVHTAALPPAAILPAASLPAPHAAPAVAAAAAVPVAAPALAASPVAALGAASTMVPGHDEAPAAGAAKAAAAFDGGRPLNILMAGAEAVPFIKTGGLADVVDAVSRGMVERGHKVMMVLPKYRSLKLEGVQLTHAGDVTVPIDGQDETAKLWTAKVKGVDVVLIDHAAYYDRPGGPYQGNTSSYGTDGNAERFAFYSRAALEAAKALGFQPDIAHAHDWHAGLIPAYLKLVYGGDPFFAATRSLVTIHNLAFQGVYSLDTAHKLGFKGEHLYATGPLEYWGNLSYLKGGLVLADAVTTVSPTYAREIRENPEFGMGMDPVLNARKDGVRGILNGLDPELNDPRTDQFIVRNYGAEDVAAGKAENKAAIQEHRGLDQDPNAPLFVVASRLAAQKGIDLILDTIDEIVARGGQVLVTGSGDKALEEQLATAVAKHPGKVASHPFDEVFVHAVYAAADFLLMPSRFEPCGLSQLIAHRYGTLPIVNPTGGLADTVRDLRSDAVHGDGIVMREFSMLGLVEAVEAAIAGYRHPDALPAARATAMANDSSWGPALAEYEALYRKLLGESVSRPASAAPASGASASSTSSAKDARRDGSTAP
jgi:starch synthase